MNFSFFTENGKLLSFGFFMTLASSFGQTYFISIFGPEIQAEFGLSHTLWGTVYLIGTLCSAFLLTYSGSLIDRYNLKHYTIFVLLFLCFSCVFVSYVSNIIFLTLAVFFLRQSGQGLTSHTSVTTMARYFDNKRGSAVAISSMGMAAGETLFPLAAVLMISLVGWRWAYFSSSLLVIIFFLPLVLFLLKGHEQKYKTKSLNEDILGGERSWSRMEVIKDVRFYLLLPALLAPSIIMTALFFHHLNIADYKNWSHIWITGNYFIYAISTVFMSLIVGILVDRFKAVRLFEYGLIPLILGLFCLSYSSNDFIIIPYMMLIGFGSGFGYTIPPVLIAELYGVKHLGSIKSLVSALTVFGSAIGPVIVGGLMDLNFSIEIILFYFAFFCIISTILIRFGLRKDKLKI